MLGGLERQTAEAGLQMAVQILFLVPSHQLEVVLAGLIAAMDCLAVLGVVALGQIPQEELFTLVVLALLGKVLLVEAGRILEVQMGKALAVVVVVLAQLVAMLLEAQAAQAEMALRQASQGRP